MRLASKLATVTLILSGLSLLSTTALAGDPCGGLWYERNAIYASAGHCFKTSQGIAQFGKGCFPPYGKLSSSQQARVNRIIAKERAFGC